MSGERLLSASVVIPTYRRASYVAACLEHLARQTVAPREVVIVDASDDEDTEAVVRRFPTVRYMRSTLGPGTTASSRAIGLAQTTGEIVAFVDDDAFPRPDWLEQLLRRYSDPEIAGVGGRVDNGRPGEEREGLDRVGQLTAAGDLTGYFAAMTAGDVDVDHMLGANMSMRRSVIDELGGLRDYYPGTCLREETDIALRARMAGYRIVYTPDAVVRHVAGTYARGRRFDLRYTYFAARNHVVLLRTALGPGDVRARALPRRAARQTRDQLAYALRAVGRLGTGQSVARGAANGLLRAATTMAGTLSGYVASERHLRQGLPAVDMRRGVG